MYNLGLDTFLEAYFHQLRTFSPRMTLGLEQEGFFLDSNGRLSCLSDEVISRADHRALNAMGINLVGELSLFAFELNGFVFEKSIDGLIKLAQDLKRATQIVEVAAQKSDLSILYTGIPKSLQKVDLVSSVLRKSDRITLLEEAWQARFRSLKTKPSIDSYVPESIAITGCCSSSQYHLTLPPSDTEAVKVWNAAHLVTIPLIGIAANSKYFLGQEAYAETRNIIWQRLDDLGRGRVFYGPIVYESMMEVAKSYLSLPSLSLEKDAPRDEFEAYERHAKSVWPFIRLVLAKDHWRIENRAIASNSVPKTIANFALYLGLIENVLEVQSFLNIDFTDLSSHFFRVSEGGLDYLAILSGQSPDCTYQRILEIAESGLIAQGFDPANVTLLLNPLR